MSVKDWEAKVLRTDGAARRVAEIEDELRLAAGLTALRERGYSIRAVNDSGDWAYEMSGTRGRSPRRKGGAA